MGRPRLSRAGGRLTSWMRRRLRVWAWIPDASIIDRLRPEERVRIVEPLETQIKFNFLAPCNVDGVIPVRPGQISSKQAVGRCGVMLGSGSGRNKKGKTLEDSAVTNSALNGV
jgi:hypothetical protein